MCEFRGTDKHDDCDGFCYLRKNIEHQHGGEQEQPHSDKAIYSYQFSSMYGLLESHKNPSSPYLKSERYGLYSNLNLYTIYPDILSPPPRS
ncbi:MAG: hypothetical protein JXR20_12820 [Balneola sp.]